ncbi:MAG: UDP-N-acetylglucosamine 2-epimerase [Phycisphaerales bacterium]
MSAVRCHVAVVTGSRAEFGLLRPVIRAMQQNDSLRTSVIVAGSHLRGANPTRVEVENEFQVAAHIAMQEHGKSGRDEDVRAVGRGMIALADVYTQLKPDVVLVLGDRIEAFAAGAAAALQGIHLAHMHGGDRAEGVADESMRHALSKLAHIHCPATAISAQRLIKMGEQASAIYVVGSPAIDGVQSYAALGDERCHELGQPQIVVLHHPIGDDESAEYARMKTILKAARACGRVLVMAPNYDAGRNGIARAIEESGIHACPHLARNEFIGLLRRAVVLVGNSSAGLIECAALGVRCINIGSRQNGRECAGNVTDIANADCARIKTALEAAIKGGPWSGTHPFGSGNAGMQTAEVLGNIDLTSIPLRKLNAY